MIAQSGATEPTTWGLAASAILVALALAVSAWRRLGVERSLLWAALAQRASWR